MKLKRILGFVLTLTMLVSICIPCTMAAGQATVSLSSGEVKAGETVTLTAQISNNPGVAAYMLYIYYDTSVFTLDPSSDLNAAGVFGSSGMTIGNSIELARANGRYDGEPDKDGALVLWFNGSGMNTTGDGSLLTVTLQAKAGAANGNYAVELGYSPDDTCNQDGQNVSLLTSSATVTVTGGVADAPTTTPPAADSGTQTPEQPGTSGSGTTQTPTEPTPTPDSGSGTTQTQQPTVPENPTGSVIDVPTQDGKETVSFLDVNAHWAQDYITAAAELGLIQGYQGLYRPDDTMTRAECVTILWRAAGSPKPAKAASFTDLTQDWYRDAVAWAEENGVVNGMGGGKFAPNGTVTREQLATILYRQAGAVSGMEMLLSGIYDKTYTDSAQVSSWAKAGLYWSIFNVIYCGEHSTDVGSELAPREAADRAQIAVMIVRYLEMEGDV